MCQVSNVTSQFSFCFLFFYKVAKLVGGVSVINGADPGYLNWGLFIIIVWEKGLIFKILDLKVLKLGQFGANLVLN